MTNAANPCEYREHRQLGPVNLENRPEKTHKGDVSFVNNVNKYSQSSQYSHRYSHPQFLTYRTREGRLEGPSQYSHCFRELLTSKVIA